MIFVQLSAMNIPRDSSSKEGKLRTEILKEDFLRLGDLR